MAKQQVKEHWGSRIGVILAVAGSAVGLGNFLRFPGQAAQHGGGAFMIPYFVSLLILGIPVCWAEWTMGRYGGNRGFNSAPGIFHALWPNPISKYLGGVALVVPLVIYMYYVVIEAWCLGYSFFYLTGQLNLGSSPESYATFFDRFAGTTADASLFATGNMALVSFVLFAFVLNFFFVYRGLSGGIEKFCMWAMPTMAIFGICVLVRVLTLGTPDPSVPDRSIVNGLGYMWNPNYSMLSDPKTWLAAAGQIFFSLSVGFGIVINYASYLKKEDDVALSGLTGASVNEFFEVCLGGLITLPAAFVFFGIAAGTFGTFSLGFNVLPNVFALMPGGQFFGFIWFFLLFLAAITSSLSMLQPVLAFLEEGFGMSRARGCAVLAVITALGTSFVLYFSKGMVALDTMDFWIGTALIFVLGMIQTFLYGWAMGIEKGEIEMHRGAQLQVPKLFQYILKYVSPLYLLAIFGAFLYVNVPGYARTIVENEVALLSVFVMGGILVGTLVAIYFAARRWKFEGKLKETTR